MKKKITYLLIIFISMFMYNEVGASEKLFRCEYNVNLSTIVPAVKDTNIKYYVSVYDDGSVSVSDFSGLEALNGFYVSKASSFGTTYYNQIVENGNSCPTINFTFDGNTNFTMSSTNFVDDASSVSSNGKIIEKAEHVEEAEKKETCIRTKELRNDSVGVKITFYYQGDKKMWSIEGFYRATGSASGNVNKMLSLGDKNFQLEQDVIDKVFSDEKTCSNTKIYLRTPPGNNTNTITMIKPDPTENGSYGVNETEKDTGLNIEPEEKDEQIVTDGETIKIVKRIYDIIKVLIPVLIVVLSTVDFLKVIIYDDEKNYKSAFDKMIKRLIIGVIFFLLPILVSFVIKYSGLDVEQSYLEIFK